MSTVTVVGCGHWANGGACCYRGVVGDTVDAVSGGTMAPVARRRMLVISMLGLVALSGTLFGGRSGGITGHAAGGDDDPGGCGGELDDGTALDVTAPVSRDQALAVTGNPLAGLKPDLVNADVAATFLSGTTYYVDATAGNDDNVGTRTGAPWQSIDRVNRASLSPGDTVRFKRGGVWREQLVAQSGSSGRPITYRDYGDGDKPLLLGSIDKSATSDWTANGPGLWASGGATATTTGSNLVPNPSFTSGATSWGVYANSGAGAGATGALETTRYDTSPASYTVSCSAGSTTNSDIQLYSGNFSVRKGTYYKLTFRARSSGGSGKVVSGIKHVVARLTQGASPWGDYTAELSAADIKIGAIWTTYTVYFRANASAADARLTFFLGTALSAGQTFSVDSLSLLALTSASLPEKDVGNIILNGTNVGVKKFTAVTSASPSNDFSYDASTWTLLMASVLNPARRSSSIEVALNRDIISENNAHHVVYLNLDLRYGGAMGIGGENVANVVVRDCDFRFIGGSEQADMPGVRYGNGIQFWGNARDIVVVGCTFGEMYDTAMTNQFTSSTVDVLESNIVYVNNLVWNAEYCFEYFARRPGTTGGTDHISFLNNTCLSSGGGWSHAQRPDPSGRDLTFWNSDGDVTDFYVANNIFVGAVQASVYVRDTTLWLGALHSDHNLYAPAASATVLAYEVADHIDHQTLSQYAALIGGDAHSLNVDPQHVSSGDWDALLSQVAAGQTTTSPAVDAGSSLAADLCWNDDRGRRCLSSLSTRSDGVDDTGTVDLGFHVP